MFEINARKFTLVQELSESVYIATILATEFLLSEKKLTIKLNLFHEKIGNKIRRGSFDIVHFDHSSNSNFHLIEPGKGNISSCYVAGHC